MQTLILLGVPFTTALTLTTLGFQVLLERLWEWETLIPNVTPLPHTSHFAMRNTSFTTGSLSKRIRYLNRIFLKMQGVCKKFSVSYKKYLAFFHRIGYNRQKKNIRSAGFFLPGLSCLSIDFLSVLVYDRQD